MAKTNCTQACNNIFLFLIMATMFMMMLFSTSFNFSQCLHLQDANYLPQSTIKIVRSMFFHNCSFVIVDFDEFYKNIFVSWCKDSEIFAIKKMIKCIL
jgi:hypothetical protein